MAAAIGRRRRRSKGPCPNSLFVRWVEEWRDEAREKGMKTQYAYAKVLHPLVFNFNNSKSIASPKILNVSAHF